MKLCTSVCLLAAAAAPALSAATGKTKSKPFNTLVAFGDQLVDNGNGSYAHGLDPNNAYGYHTWTDGPVVPSYLADLLGVPLVDYAWGGAYGGGLAGPTIDNAYTPAKDSYNGQPVPSSKEQIYNNYTAHGAPPGISRALQFVWVGQNDFKKHTNWYAADPTEITVNAAKNVDFYNNFTSILVPQVEHLIGLGAPAVIVLNIFPIQLAPEDTYFFCKRNKVCKNNWGKVVVAANNALESALKASPAASKIIYYDVYSYMMHIMANKDSFGFTEPLTDYCDGDHTLAACHWAKCTKYHPSSTLNWAGARPYFWFDNGNMETHVHEFIAQDIAKTVQAFFGNTTG